MGPVIERSSPAIQGGNVQNAAGGVSSTSVIHHHHQQVGPVPVFYASFLVFHVKHIIRVIVVNGLNHKFETRHLSISI